MKKGSQPVDKRVVLTLVASAVIALVILAFRYKGKDRFYAVKILVADTVYHAGETVLFKTASADPAARKIKYIAWDFGDRTMPVTDEPVVTHAYKEPGRYVVVLSVGASYKEYQTIYIKKAPVAVDAALQPRFTGPRLVYAGEEAVFTDSTPHASRWDWYFGETNTSNAFTQQAKYIFKTAGPKTVILVVNGNMQGSYGVMVESRPVIRPDTAGRAKRERIRALADTPSVPKLNGQLFPQPVKKDSVVVVKGPEISSKEISSLLLQIIGNTADPSDFEKYTCGNLGIPAKYNGMETTFKALCKDLKDDYRKESRVDKLEVAIKKNENNCIIFIDVNAGKKNLWKRVFKAGKAIKN